MRNYFFCSASLFFVFTLTTPGALAVSVTVTNPTEEAWKEAPVVIPFSSELASLGTLDLVLKNSDTHPIQVDDLNQDGKPDELVFLATVGAKESKKYVFSENTDGVYSPFRSHAGLYHKGIEGVGWESDLIAYRLYWDERNAVDIYGKKKPVLGLKQYAKPEVNYHQDTPWGMDVLKVGPSLGAGGFGVWVGDKIHKVSKVERSCEVIVDGPIRSVMDLKYTNWIVDTRRLALTARITMTAGQKWAEIELFLSSLDEKPVPELVVGVVKHEETSLIEDKVNGFLGRWGLQALGPGEKPKGSHLGFGVLVKPSQVVAFGEDAYNSYIRLKGEQVPAGKFTENEKAVYASYRIHASWIQEPGGAKTAEEYRAMLSSVAKLKPEIMISKE
ncbi:DUF4861 family protein [Candidatus Sumerlaeota bacterium]|nr:DUF4861 family protein [Candidatus Sumerlaeota bacterium]